MATLLSSFNATASKETLSVAQCVAKRVRQLERLQFTLVASVRKFVGAAPASLSAKSGVLLYSENAVIDTQSAYMMMLFQFLQQEERTLTPQLFTTALALEDYGDVMARLLELRDEEEHARQRTELHWQVLRCNAHADPKVQELLTKCEHKWLTLVYGAAYLQPTISRLQERHDDKTNAVYTLKGASVDNGDELGCPQSVITPTSFCMRPVVVVSHRLS